MCLGVPPTFRLRVQLQATNGSKVPFCNRACRLVWGDAVFEGTTGTSAEISAEVDGEGTEGVLHLGTVEGARFTSHLSMRLLRYDPADRADDDEAGRPSRYLEIGWRLLNLGCSSSLTFLPRAGAADRLALQGDIDRYLFRRTRSLAGQLERYSGWRVSSDIFFASGSLDELLSDVEGEHDRVGASTASALRDAESVEIDGTPAGLRDVIVRDGVGSTVVVHGDWPAEPDSWFLTADITYEPQDHNEVEYCTTGQLAFDAMVEAMGTATEQGHFIFLVGWSAIPRGWNMASGARAGSLVNRTLEQILAAKVSQDVTVRALFFYDMRNTLGTEACEAINALASRAPTSGGPPRALAVLDNRLHDPRGAHHQKILLVCGSEGLIAFCGGNDISPDRVLSGPGLPMHDVHVRIRGPSAVDLLTLAKLRWIEARCSGLVSTDPLPRTLDTLASLSAPPPGRPGSERVQIVQTVGNPGIHEPSDAWPTIRNAIQRAQRFIYLEDQYFWSLDAVDALLGALPRIAHLTILLPPDARNESRPHVHRAIWRLWHGAGEHLHKVGIYRRTSGRYVHSKTWIFDDELAIVGSANCNRRSYEFDSEACAVVLDRIGANWKVVGRTLAHRLRKDLWHMHTGASAEALEDGVCAGVHWLIPMAGRPVGAYVIGDGDVDWRAWATSIGSEPPLDPAADAMYEPSSAPWFWE